MKTRTTFINPKLLASAIAFLALSTGAMAQNTWQLGGNSVTGNKKAVIGTTSASTNDAAHKDLQVITNSSERMRIIGQPSGATKRGYMGLGTPAPIQKLHIEVAAGAGQGGTVDNGILVRTKGTNATELTLDQTVGSSVGQDVRIQYQLGSTDLFAAGLQGVATPALAIYRLSKDGDFAANNYLSIGNFGSVGSPNNKVMFNESADAVDLQVKGDHASSENLFYVNASPTASEEGIAIFHTTPEASLHILKNSADAVADPITILEAPSGSNASIQFEETSGSIFGMGVIAATDHFAIARGAALTSDLRLSMGEFAGIEKVRVNESLEEVDFQVSGDNASSENLLYVNASSTPAEEGVMINGTTPEFTLDVNKNTADANEAAIMKLEASMAHDVAMQYKSATTTFVMGIDQSVAGDPFVISPNAALGTPAEEIFITSVGNLGIGVLPTASEALAIERPNDAADLSFKIRNSGAVASETATLKLEANNAKWQIQTSEDNKSMSFIDAGGAPLERVRMDDLRFIVNQSRATNFDLMVKKPLGSANPNLLETDVSADKVIITGLPAGGSAVDLSGLKFTNLTSTSPTAGLSDGVDCNKVLSVDALGNVVLIDPAAICSTKAATNDDAVKEAEAKLEAVQAELDALKAALEAYGLNVQTDVELQGDARQQIILNQNEPNPFGERTTINYVIPSDVKTASMVIYDMNGKLIREESLNTGFGSLDIYAADLATGMYSYSIVADGQVIDSKKMVKQ